MDTYRIEFGDCDMDMVAALLNVYKSLSDKDLTGYVVIKVEKQAK